MRTIKENALKLKLRLFEEERLLIIVSALGFLLAFGCGLYIFMKGAVILPEGNVESAFSFNAAVAIFILSVAALMPVSGLNRQARAKLRWGFTISVLISYGIETVQHFRGINPRFSQAGSMADMIFGIFFGLTSFILVVVTVILAFSFFSRSLLNKRPLLVLGIRYAFVSTMIAFAAGIIMIILQGRYVGHEGNFIVIHGIGFHALQTLTLLGWLQERTQRDEAEAQRLVHIGSIAWLMAVIAIGVQTILGRNVFELSVWPIISALALLTWVLIMAISFFRIGKRDLDNR